MWWIVKEAREEPERMPGRSWDLKTDRRYPASSFILLWSSWLFFWLVAGLPDNPPHWRMMHSSCLMMNGSAQISSFDVNGSAQISRVWNMPEVDNETWIRDRRYIRDYLSFRPNNILVGLPTNFIMIPRFHCPPLAWFIPWIFVYNPFLLWC